VFTLATDMIVGSAPPERAGAASAISETGSELGGALGIAVLGSIGAAFYRAEMAGAVSADVPTAAVGSARATLAGAIVAAEQLPLHLGVELLAAAYNAFTQSVQLMAGISAVVIAITAIVVAITLRDVQTDSESASVS
jgi:MFS transporter, DHA2 family, multidrug resistance protein